MNEKTYLYRNERSKPIHIKRFPLGFVLTLAGFMAYGYWQLSYGLSHMDLSGFGQFISAVTERVAIASFPLTFRLPPGEARTETFVSPDGKITAFAYARGPKGAPVLQELQFRTKDGRLLSTEDFRATYPRSNFSILNAKWSGNSEFFIFTVRNGDHPDLSPLTFEYTLKSNTLRLVQ